MESIHDHSLNDINKCNKDCADISSIFSDSAINSCKDIHSHLNSKELKLSDRSNGNISINCKLSNANDSVDEEMFIKDDSLIEEEKNSIGDLEDNETLHNVAGDSSGTVKEQNKVISTDPLEELNCHSTSMEMISLGKHENLNMNSIDMDSNLIDLPSTFPLDQEVGNKTLLDFKSDPLSSNSCSSEVVTTSLVNKTITVESPSCIQSSSENCDSTLLLPTTFLDNNQTIDSINSVFSKDSEEQGILEHGFLTDDHSNATKNDSLFKESLCTSGAFIVQNCIVEQEEISTNLSKVSKIECQQDDDKEKDSQCIIQGVLNGSLQPLNIQTLESNDSKTDPLYVSIPHNISSNNDKIGLVPESAGISSSYNEDTIHLTNLTEPPPVHLETHKELIEEENSNLDVSACPTIDAPEGKDESNGQHYEGKPALLKVMPIKNGHGLWNIEELRLLLEDRGSVLLRLCAAPEAGNEDIIEGPQADFTALLLEDSSESSNIPEPEINAEAELSKSLRALNSALMDQCEDSTLSNFSQTWKEPRVQNTPKRKCLPPPPSFLFGSLTAPGAAPPRGRKRGRPPLHNRPWAAKGKAPPAPNRFQDDPIKYRPPTPPAPPEKALARGKIAHDPRVSCASLSTLKRPAPGSLLSRRLLLARREEAGESAPRGPPNACPYCPLRFRRKPALVEHVKGRHKQLLECPICRGRLGKEGLKAHMTKEHGHEKGFRCDPCGEVFRLQLHLRNHWRLVHEAGVLLTKEEEVVEPRQTAAAAKSEPKMKLRSTPQEEGGAERLGEGAKEEESVSSGGNESDDEGGADSSSDSSLSAPEEEKKRYFCDVCQQGFSHVFKLRHHKKSHAKGGAPPRSDALRAGLSELRVECVRFPVGGKLRGRRSERRFSLQVPLSKSRQAKQKAGSPSRLDKAPSHGTRAQPHEEEAEDSEGHPPAASDRPPYIVRKGRAGFECLKCQLSFKREKQMTYHLKKIHETLYPFRKCPHCTRVFRSCGPYTRHLREHRGRRCPVEGCRAKYKVLRLIKKHQRHAHPEMPQRCQRCVALFAEEDELERHTEEVHRKRKDGEDEEGADEEEEEEEEEEPKKKKVSSKREDCNAVRRAPPKRGLEEEDAEVVHVSGRRACAANISYREDDEEEEIVLPKTVPFSPPAKKNPTPKSPSGGKRPPSSGPPSRPTPPPPSTPHKASPPAPAAHPNPLKNLREALMLQTKAQQKGRSEAPSGEPRPKRAYVRRAPYKKRKVDTGWTAALNEDLGGSCRLLGAGSSPSAGGSPGITADVVRRVAESLLSRHQEQKQKKLLTKQRRSNASSRSALSGSQSQSSRLPRITYSALAAAAAAVAAGSAGDASSEFAAIRRAKVPDPLHPQGPAKVLGFDNF